MEKMNNTLIRKDEYKLSRFLYIIEAMLEYFIALGIGTVYLAKLAKEIGMSDSLVAVIEAFVSLGASFRIFAILLSNKKPVKIWVTTMHLISQVFFALIWFVPLIKISKIAQTVLLIVLLLFAYLLHNLCYPAKTNMYMSCVEDNKRGSFTATKEMVSLAGGMAFTLLYGNLIDFLEGIGKKELAFILCGSLLLLFMVGHTLSLVFAKEKLEEVDEKKYDIKQVFKQVFSDKKIFLVISVYAFYNVIHYMSIPFYSTYQINELGFSMAYVPIVAAVGSIVRFVFSKPIGKVADKYSFNKSMTLCFIFLALSYLVMTFTNPSNGKYMYIIYITFNSIAAAGITSGVLNITYDYVSYENRTSALAINGAIAGLIGFLTTLAITPFFNYIQKIQQSGQKILGMTIYAQQLISVIAFVLTVLLILYNIFVIGKIKRNADLKNGVSND
ncbi:MAG: MFS transporter [Clostridia bacterium]|nr:MFS transporter [Clostridia bacterium]